MSRKYPCWGIGPTIRNQKPLLRGLGCQRTLSGENVTKDAKIEDCVPKRPPLSAYKPPPPPQVEAKCQTKPLNCSVMANSNTEKNKENMQGSGENPETPWQFPQPKTYSAQVKSTPNRCYKILLMPRKRRTKPQNTQQVPAETLKTEEHNEDGVKTVIKYEKKEWEKKGIKGITNIRTTITTVEDTQIKETYEVTDIEGPNGRTHKETTTMSESVVKGGSAGIENEAAWAGNTKKCPQNESTMEIGTGASLKEEIPANMLQGPDLANFWLTSPYGAAVPPMYQPPGAFDFNSMYPMSFYPMQLMAPAATTAQTASYEMVYFDIVGMDTPAPMPKVNQTASAGTQENKSKKK